MRRATNRPDAPGIRSAKIRLAQEVEPLFVGVEQAQVISGISLWTWRRWAQTGVIDSVKIGGRNGKLGRGGRLLIPMAEVRRMLAENFRPRLDELPQPKPRRALAG
jgi:hypothetical protein